MEATFLPLTLGNIADGKAEEQFQHLLAQLSEVFEQSELFETDKDGATRAQITIELDWLKPEGQSLLSVDVRGKLKRPNLRRVGRSVVYSAGVFTAPAFRQAELFPPVRRIETARTGEEL